LLTGGEDDPTNRLDMRMVITSSESILGGTKNIMAGTASIQEPIGTITKIIRADPFTSTITGNIRVGIFTDIITIITPSPNGSRTVVQHSNYLSETRIGQSRL
jgi:hypothetical protein